MVNPNQKPILVITGAAGFIGSCLLAEYARKNTHYLIAVDDFMNVVRCVSETNQAMIPFADGFFFVNENRLYYRDLFEGVNEVHKISTTENIRELYISGNQLIVRTSSKLNVFIIQP